MAGAVQAEGKERDYLRTRRLWVNNVLDRYEPRVANLVE